MSEQQADTEVHSDSSGAKAEVTQQASTPNDRTARDASALASSEPAEEVLVANKPRRFRPLLLGPSLMLAVYGIVVDTSTGIGGSLESANARGTLIVFAAIGWAVCAIVLSAVNSHRKGVRLPIGKVMGWATALTALYAILSWLFLATGGKLVGTVPGQEFLLLLFAGICGGVGFALTFSGWNTAFGEMSLGFVLLYLIISFVIAYFVCVACHAIASVLACALVCAVLAVAGAALLHVQVKVLDE